MTPNLVLMISSIDPFLGKVDKSAFSQETLMELLIGGVTDNKAMICGSQDEPDQLEKWKRVKLTENKEVIEINWHFLSLEGSIDLQWLPATVRFLHTYGNKLTGEIDLTCLPDEMTEVDLSFNTFTGEISLTRLPAELEALDVSNNQFFGTLDLTRLPVSLKLLHLNANDFFGETDFSKLPEKLIGLKVSITKLSGEIRHPNGKDFRTAQSGVKIIL